MRRVLFLGRQRTRNAAPGILDRHVDGQPVDILQTVFHVPDLLGDRGGEAGHGDSSQLRLSNVAVAKNLHNSLKPA